MHSLGRRLRAHARTRAVSHAAHEVHSRLAMSTTKAWGGRVMGICVIALAAGHVTGCVSRERVSPSAVPTSGDGADLQVVLADGTGLHLDGSHTTAEGICGVPSHCLGPSCARIRVDRCVPKEDVVSLKERKVNTAGIALGAAGATIGAVLVVAAVVAASSSSRTGGSGGSSSSSSSNGAQGGIGSCPRVYSWDGAGWKLDSGTFGVSYFEAAPRTDFDRLDQLAADHGSYRLRLVNEQDETEHTDLVRLRVVDHPAGTRVVPTAAGKLVTFRDEATPTVARDFRGRDALDLVKIKDDREWSSDLRDRSALRSEDARDGLRLVFAKPQGAKVAKLRVAAHNTDWAGNMLGYLFAHRGATLPAWFTRMNTDARARGELEAFLIREGMLNVRVKTPAGWSSRGVFWAAGSEIVKEEAFELSVTDIPGDMLEIELESALDFWSIDAASVAYGENEPTVVHSLSPSSARTNDGRDVTGLLARADSVRFDTVRGDVAELSFAAPAPGAPDSVRSFVLETNGYYVPEITPAADADPAAMDALMDSPFAASRLALAFRIATRARH